MPMISENWAALLEPGLRQIFDTTRTGLAAVSRIPTLYNVLNSQKAQEHDLGIGGMSDWKEFKGAIEYDTFEKGFQTTYTHAEFAQGIAIERKLVDDDLYNIINARPRQLAISAMRKREKDAASLFNNAFSASYLGGDGKALCATDHPLSPSNATGQSNKGTTALSYSSIVATRQLMRAYLDDRGELVAINPDTILVPPELEATAYEQLRSELKPDTANNNISFVNSLGIRVVVWDYLTDSNNWFMMDSQLMSLYLNWFERIPLEFVSHPASDFDLVARYRGYMRYSYGWSDWRFVYGHEVAGA
jgi:phage major head subunit gpT-like protein